MGISCPINARRMEKARRRFCDPLCSVFHNEVRAKQRKFNNNIKSNAMFCRANGKKYRRTLASAPLILCAIKNHLLKVQEVSYKSQAF